MGTVARKAVDALGTRVTAVAERFWHEADAMRALLIKRADEFAGCTEGSPEEEELRTLADVIDGYEAKRWPSGKVVGGKAPMAEGKAKKYRKIPSSSLSPLEVFGRECR
jgi:hypothetical protein